MASGLPSSDSSGADSGGLPRRAESFSAAAATPLPTALLRAVTGGDLVALAMQLAEASVRGGAFVLLFSVVSLFPHNQKT